MHSCENCETKIAKEDAFEDITRPRYAKTEGETKEKIICRWCAGQPVEQSTDPTDGLLVADD